MKLQYWTVCSSSMMGGDEVNGLKGAIVILARCVFHLMRDNENLV